MKKCICLLALLCALLLAVPAVAAPGDARVFKSLDEDDYSSLSTMAATSDSLYAVVANSQTAPNCNGLFRYDIATQETVMLDGNLTPYYSYLDNADDRPQEKIISLLVAEKDELFAVNFALNTVSKLTMENEQLVFTPAGTIDSSVLMVQDGEYSYQKEIYSTVKKGDLLYIASYSYDEASGGSKVYVFDLKAGSYTQLKTELSAYNFALYHDNLALVMHYDPNNSWDMEKGERILPEIHSLDLTTGASTKIATLKNDANGLCYDEAADKIYYIAGTEICCVSPDGTGTTVAYMPTEQYTFYGTKALNGFVVTANYEEATIYNVDPAYLPSTVLTIYNGYSSEADVAFSQTNPEIALSYYDSYFDSDELLTQALSASSEIDIVSHYGGSSLSIDDLIRKGFCADLSGYPELMSAVEKLYPYLKDYVMRDGKLYAVPTDASVSAYWYNNTALEAVGLTKEDLPTTYMELIDFISRWNDELALDFPEYSPIYGFGYMKQNVLLNIINEYIQYYQAMGEDLSFDTPLFNSLIAAIENMHTDNFDLIANEKESEDGWDMSESVLENYGQIVEFSLAKDEEQRVWPLALDEGLKPIYQAYVSSLYISPNSDSIDAAAKYLLNRLQKLEDYNLGTMDASIDQSIEMRGFDQSIERMQEEYERYVELAKTGEEDMRREYEDIAAMYKEHLDNQENYRYSVNINAVELFRNEYLDGVVVTQKNMFSDEGINKDITAIVGRFLAKEIPAEQFVKELEKKNRMLILESK